MPVTAVALLLVFALPAPCRAVAQRSMRSVPHSSVLAFRGATVVNVADGHLVPDQTVIVDGTRIRAVGAVRDLPIPTGAQIVDARGKYLIPGLWDMHIHVMGFPEIFYPLLIANGVTGIRDMGTPIPLDTVHRWQREVAAGARVGPRQLNAGGSLNEGDPTSSYCQTYTFKICLADGPQFPLYFDTPARARHLVDSLRAAGADLIKAREIYSRDLYFAVTAEARRVGLPIGGHLVARGVTIPEALDSGQRTFEHGTRLRSWCSYEDSAASEARCAELAARLRRYNAWITTSSFAVPRDVSARDYWARKRYWPDSVTVADWREDSAAPPRSVAGSEEAIKVHWPAPAGRIDTLEWRREGRVGMPLLTGTDAGPIIADLLPGFSLQDEVMVLVEGGLSPLAALQAATLNPAQYLNATDSLGTVAPGKLADFVLLDANPLEDIHHLRRIRAVVANGRYFDRGALDELLAGVERQGAPHWRR